MIIKDRVRNVMNLVRKRFGKRNVLQAQLPEQEKKNDYCYLEPKKRKIGIDEGVD